MQPDLGTSLVFIAILAGTLFLSGASLPWLAVFGGIGLAAMPVIWNYVLRDYQKQRLTSFLDPAADPLGSGYQLVQSRIAVGSGGLFGKGITNGTQNQLDFLPVQTTDFVYAILAEELGFIGGVLVLGLFVALLWRVLLAGWRAEDPFALAFSAGMASMILFQVLVNVGMVIGIMPITGIPLPFVTHGGASLISIAVGLGILQSINLRQIRPLVTAPASSMGNRRGRSDAAASPTPARRMNPPSALDQRGEYDDRTDALGKARSGHVDQQRQGQGDGDRAAVPAQKARATG
jgi:rod shape determining protein RodA